MNNNPYAVLNNRDLALVLYALSGYPTEELCEQFGKAEAVLRSRFQGGDYPPWYSLVAMEVFHTMMRCIPPDDHDYPVYIPWTSAALAAAQEQGPAFFNRQQKLTEISACLSHYGTCLRWNRPERTLEVVLS